LIKNNMEIEKFEEAKKIKEELSKRRI